MPLFIARGMLVTIIFQICLYYFDLYDLSFASSFSDTATRILQAFGVGCIVLAIIYYLVPIIIISSNIFWTGYIAICMSIAIWRFFYSMVLDRRMFTQPILLLGSGMMAEKISDEIESKRDSGYKIVALVANNNDTLRLYGIQTINDVNNLKQVVEDSKVEKIVVTLADRRGKTPIKELMACKLQGIPIVKGVEFYESLTGKIMVENVNPDTIIFSEGFKKSRLTLLLKRITDTSLAIVGLTILLPIIVLTSLLIKLESSGPVFYVQERVGEKRKTYKIIKFRSMSVDAEKNGPVWAGKNDSRVTKVGSFIRKVRIDEIPQMWNVLKGEMSFVGPRPERPVFVEQLEKIIPYYSLRHNVKPGITGWAQIFYPYGASAEDALRKLEYDLYYIKNMSIRMDLWVIFQTIKIILFQKGAR
jgi:sugar transferase (PEP-CTERM system associated)